MLFASLLIWGSTITAHVLADTETDRILQRNADIQARRLSEKPVQGVRKMSDDEGEKFFLDYWHFEEDINFANSTEERQVGEVQGTKHTDDVESNFLPRSYPFQPSFDVNGGQLSFLRFSSLVRKDFQCPAGTVGCSSIDRPDSCCHADETCVIVQDTGSGDVGCCGAGQDCSGTIGSCDQGYTSCPSSLGGGCCFPGYECVSGGCARVLTVTVTTHSTVVVSTSTETIPPTSASTTATSDSTSTSGSSSSTSTSTSTKSTAHSTSTGDLVPPSRPTSLSTATTSSTGDVCPTGFYACSAVYHGGCCRTGRDCDTTSCPVIPSTTIVTNDATIVIPVETSKGSSGTGRCASGWFSCADTVGGGCCPTGYACGSSCTAVTTASATGTLGKEAPPNQGSRMVVNGVWKMLGGSLAGMMWMMI